LPTNPHVWGTLEMPGYKTHTTAGLVVFCVAIFLVGWAGVYRPQPGTGVALAVLCLLGALLPDIDTDSKGQNLFYGGLVILDAWLLYTQRYKWAAVLGFCALLPALGHHRGWTHTWWAMLLVPLPVLVLPTALGMMPWPELVPYYGAVVLGYFSHLVLDRKL